MQLRSIGPVLVGAQKAQRICQNAFFPVSCCTYFFISRYSYSHNIAIKAITLYTKRMLNIIDPTDFSLAYTNQNSGTIFIAFYKSRNDQS